MSGSSANAAARRRRAEPTPSINRQIKTEPVNKNVSVQPDQSNKISPLQILQNHEEQITNLTENLDKVINDIMEKKLIFYTEKIKNMELHQTNLTNKMDMMSKTIETITNTNIDKMNLEFSKQLHEFKDMLIKNQASVLDFSNELTNLKDSIGENQNQIQWLSEKSNIDRRDIETSMTDSIDENKINSTKMLFDALLKNNLFQSELDNENILDIDDESDKEDGDTIQTSINLGEEITLEDSELIESVSIKKEIEELTNGKILDDSKIDIIEDQESTDNN